MGERISDSCVRPVVTFSVYLSPLPYTHGPYDHILSIKENHTGKNSKPIPATAAYLSYLLVRPSFASSDRESPPYIPSPLSLSRADSAPVFYDCRPQSRQRPRVDLLLLGRGPVSLMLLRPELPLCLGAPVRKCGWVLGVSYFLQPRPASGQAA